MAEQARSRFRRSFTPGCARPPSKEAAASRSTLDEGLRSPSPTAWSSPRCARASAAGSSTRSAAARRSRARSPSSSTASASPSTRATASPRRARSCTRELPRRHAHRQRRPAHPRRAHRASTDGHGRRRRTGEIIVYGHNVMLGLSQPRPKKTQDGLHRGRRLPHRRHGLPRRRRLSLHHRPHQGAVQARERQVRRARAARRAAQALAVHRQLPWSTATTSPSTSR